LEKYEEKGLEIHKQTTRSKKKAQIAPNSQFSSAGKYELKKKNLAIALEEKEMFGEI